ncbi:MAG: alanyl-tRNA editing protein [Terracidiphilus sp.]
MQSSERLYHSDSFLRSFTATVTGLREAADGQAETRWQLSLDRTAFYPASGGQPFDMGLLRASAHGAEPLEIPVEQVEEDEDGTIWHWVRTPLAKGTQVEGQIDWERRFDHMQQHTGQHLLSAIFLRESKAPTVSFHLGESVSTIDLATGSLAQRDLERVERMVNEIVA